MRSFVVILSLLLNFTISSVHAVDKTALSEDLIKKLETKFADQGNRQNLINAVTNNNINDLSLNRDIIVSHNKQFSHRLNKSGITNQKGSGRCWLFAGLNVFNPNLMNKLELSSFELSQPYLTFWDKMEKANTFLEEIIRLRDRPYDDRELGITLEEPFGDGGWWHYVTALLDKYGAVPITAMPETKQSTSTGTINALANCKLRMFASEMRDMHTNGKTEDQIRERKKEMLEEIYTLMVFAYGAPPKEFVFRYESKDSTVSESKTYTPQSFYKEFLADNVLEYVTIMNNPSKEFNKVYQMQASRNMADRPDMTMLNLSIDKLKAYSLKALLDSQAVWFACDVGKGNYGNEGIFAANIYDYNTTLGLDFKISKRDRIQYFDSSPNHAMVLLGVDTTTEGKPVKWLVENSWGTDKGDNGYWYMYDDWFNEYVYFTIIDKKLLDKDDLEKLKQKPIITPMWDPFYQVIRNSKN